MAKMESLNLAADEVAWADPTRRYRVPLTVATNGFERRDKPTEIDLNFTALLNDLGQNGSFSLDSLRVVEMGGNGVIINDAVPFQFDRTAEFNAGSNATGTLIILMEGLTPAGEQRHFQLYFDTTDNGPFNSVAVSPRMTVTDNVQDAGQLSYKIETVNGTYYYHKDGGGFSSLDDRDGNDWISHSTARGSAGDYRGIPNMVHPRDGGYFHPGRDTARSVLTHQGPLKTTIVSTSEDNDWQVMWQIFPEYAQMSVLKAGGRYWFLYEGTPGGKLDLNDDLVVRSDGTQTTAGTRWTGDIAGEEWVYFADPAVGRSLYLIHHEEDTIVDSYYPMDSVMTVFGFGRSGNSRSLTGTDNHFTFGLTDQTTHADLTTRVHDSYQPLTITVGNAETVPSGPQPTPTDTTPTNTPTPTATATNTPMPTNTPEPPATDTPAACDPDPGNLLANPGFESGTDPWKFRTGGRGSFEASNDEAYQCELAALLTFRRVGRGMQLYQDGFALQENTRYRLSFAAKSSAGRDLQLFVNRSTANRVNYGLDGERFNLTADWQVFTTEFTTTNITGTTTDTRLRFWFSGLARNGDRYWIDDLQLVEIDGSTSPTPTDTPTPTATPTATATPGDPATCAPDPSNILTNPGFETGTEAWVFRTGGRGSFTLSEEAYQCEQAALLTFTRIGRGMQFFQDGFLLKENTRYQLSFAAKSSSGDDLVVYVNRRSSARVNYGVDAEKFDLTESWQVFTTEFTTTNISGSTTDTRLRFWFSGQASNGDLYWIDDVQFVEVGN
jgi:hypothetical protein